MLEKLRDNISSFLTREILSTRKNDLDVLVEYILAKAKEKKPINLNFICTHNSRRSHLSQVWAQIAANHYKIKDVYCYSGGTEATAMFIKVAETLSDQGIEVMKLSNNENPVYALKYDRTIQPIITFSKKYDDPYNPRANFAAIMTCDHADANCPLIIGADTRITVRYEDPKKFDETDLQDEKYLERSVQIASEMFYVFRKVSKSLI